MAIPLTSASPQRLNRGHRRVLVPLLLALLAGLVPGLVAAVQAEQHGVVRSVPEANAIVTAPPMEVLVEFEGDLAADQVELFIRGPQGQDIATGPWVVDGPRVTMPVDPQVPDGIYRLSYEVVVLAGGDGPNNAYSGTIKYNLSTTGCESRIRNQGPYTSIQSPDFAAPPQSISAIGADKTFPTLLYATNGRVLHRTVDGGCSWEVALELGNAESTRDALITEILTPREAPGMVVAMVLDPIEGSGLVQPRIFSTITPGGTLVEGGTGLPPLRLDPDLPLRCRHPQPCDVKVNDGSMTIPSVYVVAEPADALGVVGVFRSDDAGGSFNLAGVLRPDVVEDATDDLDVLGAVTEPTALVKAATVAPDPSAPDTVWVSTGQAVHVSTDRGQSFTVAHRIAGGEGRIIARLDAGQGRDDRGVPRRDLLAVVTSDRERAPVEQLLRLVVAGTSLVQAQQIDTAPLDGAWLDSVARGPQPDQYLLLPERDADRPGAFEYEAALGALLDLDLFELTPWRGATWTNPICSRWVAHDDAHLYVVDADDGHAHAHDAGDYCPQPEEAFDGNSIDIVKFPAIAQPADGSAAIAPLAEVVKVLPGQAQDRLYGIARGPIDTPLDIAFLFDSSGSMRDNVEQVRASFATIVELLQERGIDAQFGLAEFNDWSMRYRRLADIGRPEDGFAAALSQFQASSGENEPHLTALHQLATGDGLTAIQQGSSVRPGLQMNFRPGAVRVVLMASDEAITADPDGPGFDETVASLVDKEILHVGMHIPAEVGGGNNSTPSADNPAGAVELRGQMRELSRATGAFAVNGVDCNGDGTNDVHRGEPLVCTLGNDIGTNSGVAAPAALARALVDLVTDVTLDRDFRLEAPTVPGFAATATAVGLQAVQGGYPRIDITRPQNLTWQLSFQCFGNVVGTTSTFPVRAFMADQVIASTTATIVCGTQPGTAIVAIAPPAPPVVAAAIPPPVPPPPPAPIPANAPASAAQAAQANAVAQASANAPAVAAAVAPQVQEQAQQAEIGRSSRRPSADDEFAFTAVRSRNDTAPVATIAGAFVMAAGVAAAEARRRQSTAARVRVGRR